MIERPQERIHPDAKKVWRLNGMITLGVELLLVVGYVIGRLFVDWLPLWPIFPALGLFGVLGLLNIVIVPHIRMMYWGYAIKEEEIDIQFGLIVIRRALIPMRRVQHVDIEYGPIMRHFHLASLSITTAGSNHTIPALDIDTARTLHQQIATLVQSRDEDV
ncbi:MAG: hypothetical protein EA374_07055 [Acholeplasmatales bacterium]|nr:MAG: hypothetical protein EA374_07055 [Acholeplasmatales bacterium]